VSGLGSLRALGCAWLLAACSSEGGLLPPAPAPSVAPTGDAGPPPDAGGGGQGGAPTEAKRLVIERSPFGNVSVADNLLWDGDFEWSSAFSDQYGWLFGPPFGFSLPPATVGAVCRSGLKCMRLEDNDSLLGIGVGSTAPALEASVFVKPDPAGTGCADVAVALISLSLSANEPDVEVPLESEVDAGWCRFRGATGRREGKQYLYVDNNSDADVLVDDAVLRRLDTAPSAVHLGVRSPRPELVPRLAEAREALRQLRPSDPPPRPGKEAFESWLRR
jgi:hypothetical protein